MKIKENCFYSLLKLFVIYMFLMPWFPFSNVILQIVLMYHEMCYINKMFCTDAFSVDAASHKVYSNSDL